jgi:hypothetical protein
MIDWDRPFGFDVTVRLFDYRQTSLYILLLVVLPFAMGMEFALFPPVTRRPPWELWVWPFLALGYLYLHWMVKRYGAKEATRKDTE